MRKKEPIPTVKAENSGFMENGEENTDSKEENTVDLPPLPPNYRGMIYDIARQAEQDMNAEGINRLVSEDLDYSAGVKEKRRRQYEQASVQSAFSHLKPPIPEKVEDVGRNCEGLNTLVEGICKKSFLPEDVLICAMIILMLSGGSEDDILMVLVLLLLL